MHLHIKEMFEHYGSSRKKKVCEDWRIVLQDFLINFLFYNQARVPVVLLVFQIALKNL